MDDSFLPYTPPNIVWGWRFFPMDVGTFGMGCAREGEGPAKFSFQVPPLGMYLPPGKTSSYPPLLMLSSADGTVAPWRVALLDQRYPTGVGSPEYF